MPFFDKRPNFQASKSNPLLFHCPMAQTDLTSFYSKPPSLAAGVGPPANPGAAQVAAVARVPDDDDPFVAGMSTSHQFYETLA